MQDGGFVGFGYIRILQHLVDLVLAEIVVDFVREVAGIHPGFVAQSFDRVRDVRFFAFAADEDAAGVDVAGDVVADFFFGF
jgi:hypothetical protein